MTDNGKKYLINVGDEAEMWTSDMYAEKGDKLFSSFSDAQVFEVEDADDFDEDPTNHQYIINVGDESEVWDSDMVKEKGAKLKEAYPDVRIQRVSYKDYWGEQATLNRERKAELMKPDAERNARLAELGYYDDMTGEANAYTQSEEGVPQFGPSIGLKPLSSVMSQSPVTGLTMYADPKVAEFFTDDTYADRQAEIARLDAEYESNPAVIAQREWEAQWRADQAKYNAEYRGNLQGEIDALETTVDASKAGRGDAGKRMSPKYGMSAYVPTAEEMAESEKRAKLVAARTFLEKANIADQSAGKGFWGAAGDTAKGWALDSATQGDVDTYNKIGDILTNLEKDLGGLGEEQLTDEVLEQYLSPEDKLLILSFFNYNEAMANAQVDMKQAYKAGKIFAESVPFMLEFLVTGGFASAGSAATKGTAKVIEKGIAKALVKWVSKKSAKKATRMAVARGLQKTATGLMGAATGTLTRTLASHGTYNRMAEESVKIEDGHLHRGKNAFKAFADAYIENLSEISGGVIGKTLGKFGVSPSELLGKVSFGKIGQMLADNRLAQALAKGTKALLGEQGVLTKFGFNGIFEEVEEEYIGNLIREFTIQDGALAEMHKDDNFGAMLIGFAPMTLFGAGMSAVQMGATNLEAANLGKKLRETLRAHYDEKTIDHMMNLVKGAENADEVWEAMRPLTAGLDIEETKQLFQYGAFMAQNNAMLFAKKAQDDNLAQAKRAQLQQTYNKFWQTSEEGAESVQMAEIKDKSAPGGKRTVFVISAPNAEGVVSVVDIETGKVGFSNTSEYVTEVVDGVVTPRTNTMSMDAYLEAEIASERMTAEQARMTRERDAQIQNLQSQITRGTKINLGTTGNPIWMVANGNFSKDGVFAIDSTGATHTIGWEQVADAMKQPIKVKTDQEIIDEEIAALVARNAERRKSMTNATPAMTDAVNESAVQSAEVVAQEERHIPMNEDGTVNEIAFWEQDPEGYAAWNDEQNQDGGADTRQQIANSKAILAQMLNEAVAQQQTSNPVVRKQAKKNAEEIQAQIDKLTALEAKYEEQRIAPFRERAMKWKSLTNAPVHIIENEADLAALVGESFASQKGARVRGLAKDGKAYIYLPGIVEASEIDAVFMHEAVAHTGLKGMLGQEAFDKLCDEVWNMMSPEMQRVFINYPGVNGNTRAAADEYIAHIAEKMGAGVATAEEKTIWQKIVDFVRNVLRAMGVDINLSESELADLLHMAYKDLAKNMAEAEKIAAQNEAAAKARMNAPTAAQQKYDEYITKGLTAEEIKAGAQNEFNAAQQAYNDLQAQAPKVEMGESVEDFIARKKAYNDKLAKAKTLLDEKQTMMDEIARREKPAEGTQTPIVEETEEATPSDERLSIVSLAESVGLKFGKVGNATVFRDTKGDIVENVTPEMVRDSRLGDMIKSSVGNGFIKAEDAEKQYKFFSDLFTMMQNIQDVDLVWATSGAIGFQPIKDTDLDENGMYVPKRADEQQKFAAITGNSDKQYAKTIDFTTICLKTQAVIDVMSKSMVQLGRGLTREEIIDVVYNETHKAGEPVPCPVCYVFSRWVGLGGLLGKMKRLQQQYGQMPTEEVAAKVKELEEEVKRRRQITEGDFASKDLAKVLGELSDKQTQLKDMLTLLHSGNVTMSTEQYYDLVDSIVAELGAERDQRLILGSRLSTGLQEALDTLESELDLYNEYAWLKKVRLHPEYKEKGEVPDDILFDINRGLDFAVDYPVAWGYRTTRGPALGKAAAPYSPLKVGQVITGIASDVETAREDAKNPFLALNATDKERKAIITKAIHKARVQNLRNGQRWQSTSDFRFEYVLDVLMGMLEMQAAGSKVQLYTKVPEAVPLFASMGAEVNCSLMPLGDGLRDGELVFSPITGMDGRDARMLFERFNNVQPIMVGISDAHIRACMREHWITFIIPYHASGGSQESYVSMMETVEEAVKDRTDYSDYQSDRVSDKPTEEQKSAREVRKAILSGAYLTQNPTKAEKETMRRVPFLETMYERFYAMTLDGKSLEKQKDYFHAFYSAGDATLGNMPIMPFEYWDYSSVYKETYEEGDIPASVNGRRFMDYCAALGVTPRFSGYNKDGVYNETKDFTNEDGYWKVLIDRSMYNRDGSYHVQRPIDITNVDTTYFTDKDGNMLPSQMSGEDAAKVLYESRTEGQGVVNPSKLNDPTKVGEITEKVLERIDEAERTRVPEMVEMSTFVRKVDERNRKASADLEAKVVKAEKKVDAAKEKVQLELSKMLDIDATIKSGTLSGRQLVSAEAKLAKAKAAVQAANAKYEEAVNNRDNLAEELAYNFGKDRTKVFDIRDGKAVLSEEMAAGLSGDTRLSVITPQMDADYLAAVEAGDMEIAQRMVDEAATTAGYTIRGDHGRVSKFTVFDRNKANPEGNWGQGFYFSNNEEDVENNYATVDGPDLEAKIEREVERRVNLAEMNEDFNEDGEVDEFAIREAVEKEFITSAPNVVHAAIKMDNPFVVGHGMVEIGEDGLGHYDMEETYLTAEYETDEDGEIDYDVEPTGTLVDLAEALNDELSEYEGVNINAYEILSNNIDGMTASQFEKEARELLENSVDYLQNDDLAIMTSEIIRAAIERAGFDGIVDNTVNQKFGTARRFGRSMDGVNADTRHYIAFQSSQIKQTDAVTYDDAGNVIPLSERFNPENSDIRFSVVDTTKAELKDKPIKMNGAYRFKLKSAFKGIKDSSGQFGYVTTQIHVGTETMKDPYRVRFAGSLEGYAVIYIRPDLAKITEDEEKEHTFYLDPAPIKDALFEALKAAQNYYEAKYANGPWAKYKNPGPFGYTDWQNADKDSESSIRFSVIGEVGALRDKTPEGITRLENLDVARQMESQLNPDWSAKENEAALKIKVATGWERGADGLWRYEVDDIEIKHENEWMDSKKKLTLRDIVEPHPVFDMYPDLLDIKIVKDRSKYNLGAYYDHKKNEMKLPFGALKDDADFARDFGYTPRESKSFMRTLQKMVMDILHEVQHAIQDREGFAPGGSSDMLMPEDRERYASLAKEYNALAEEYNAILDNEGYSKAAKEKLVQTERKEAEMKRFRQDHRIGGEGYKRLAGEVEAYNVETRHGLSDYERYNSLLSSTEDVARKDQIFLMDAVDAAESSIRFSVFEPHNATIDEIDGLFRDYNMDESLTPLYDKVSALAHTMDLKIRFDYPWSAAAGSTFGDKVKFNTEFFNSLAYKSQDKAHALLHEMIHATTNYAIAARNTGALTEGMKEAVSQLEGIYGEIVNDSAFDGTYGARSVYEMVAELSNPEFRSLLKEKNLFQRIVDAIKRLLGIEVGENALDNLSATLDYMLDNYDGRVFGAVVNQYQKHQEYTRFSVVNENQAIFVSNAARAVEGIKMEKATPAQWLAMIEKNGGLKAGEDKWMGLSDWLKEPKKSKKANNVRFSALPMQEEIEAVRGLVSLESMNISHEQEKTMVKDMIDAERNLIKMLQKRKQTPLVQQQIKNAEGRLRRNLRQMEILQDVDDQLLDITPVEPDYQSKMTDMTPITREEYIAQLLTMSLSPVTQTKVVAEDGTEATIRQGGKKKGIMLSPRTLEREMGWSKSDWKGIRYIVSESEGMSLDAIAEMIAEDSEAEYLFYGMDTMEIKDALIDFLQSIGTYAEIRDYVKNARARMAEDEANDANAQREAYIEQAEAQFGMPVEQINAMTAQAAREAREMWLREAENPEEFAKFEESKNDDYGEESIEGREEGSGEEGGADDGGSSFGSESDEGVEDAEDLPEGDGPDYPGGGGGSISGGSSRGDDSRAEGEDTESGLVSTDAESGRKTVDEIVESGKQKVLEANAAAADVFMKRLYAINGDLANLRRAASAQREYDQNTVQILTRLANELLENGALSDVTRGEIKRILSVIKDAVGKSDLSVSVERLMDIMIGNQLRFGRERFKEFMKIRGKKVDARGVEVRGRLDLEGQAIMDALREGISLEAEKLEERILDAEDKLFDESDVVRRNAERDLVGYNLAKQYLENIKASETEEKDLRKELKDAETEHKEVRMTDEAWKDFKKSVHDAIRENRMQRVEAYETLLSEMASMLQKSITHAGQLREAEKARVEKIHHFANSDLQGESASAHEPKVNEFWNNPVVRLLTAPLATFEQWMRVFGKKSPEGKGYLYNYFIGKWQRANDEEYLGIKNAHDLLDAKVRTVFRGEAERWSDLFSIDKAMPRATISMWDDGEMREFEVTQGNLLYIYMVNKMTDGKMKLRKMGISESDVDAIVEQMDARFIYLADWLQDTFLPYLREKYNAVHERMFGAPMASIDSYFPIRVLANARTREVELGTDTESGRPSSITGSIIKRTKNSLALDVLGSNAFDVVLEHIEQMEHWAAFAEFNRDLNTLLSYTKFRNRVQNMSTALGAGKDAWSSFKETAEIAAGVYRPKTSKIDKAITNAVHGLTAGKISFRLWTAAKQILSMPAFLPYTNPVYFVKNLATPWRSWEWAMEELPAFQKRWKSREAGNVRLKKTEADWKLWQTNVMEAMTRWGMTPNAFVDAVTCSVGARSVYETMYERYRKDGYSHEEADKKAKVDAVNAFNATQQSSEAAYVSAIQMDRTVVAHAATVFRNNSFGMGRELVDALRNTRDRMQKGYKAQSLEYMTKQMMRDGLTPSQADRAATRIYRNSAFKDAARIATFGFAMQFLWNLGNNAVYLLFGDDDEEKKEMIKDAAIKGAFGSAEGLSFGNLVPEMVGKIASGDLKSFSPSFTPAGSDVANLWNELQRDAVAGASDLINILFQAGFGANPQTLIDAALAIYDAAEGDLEMSKEIGVALLRIMNAPQSNIDKLIMDEIDFTIDEGLDMTIEEFANRYADYKRKRNAPYTSFLYSNEGEKKQEEKYIKRFLKDAEELKRTRGNEEAKAFYNYYDNDYKAVKQTIGDAVRDIKLANRRDQDADSKALQREFKDYRSEYPYYEYTKLEGKIREYEHYKKEMQVAIDPDVKAENEQKMLKARRKMLEIRAELDYLKPWQTRVLMFEQMAKEVVSPESKEAYRQEAEKARAELESKKFEYRSSR